MDLEPGKVGRRVAIEELHACLVLIFARLGLDLGGSTGMADLLLDSELRGHADHGVAAVGILGDFYRDGLLNPRPDVRVVRETDGALLLDGDRGGGPRAPTEAMRWCVEHARRQQGMAVAAIRDWQMVVGGPFVRMAGDDGLVGFACANFIPLMAPPGGTHPVLGTNPLAFSLPARRHGHVVLDMATTTMALQKVRLAAESQTSLPDGVVLDSQGNSAVDPAAFFAGGSLAPLGSPVAPHKGFGLALLVDALSGVLSGGRFAGDVPRGPAACFLGALDVEAFLPGGEFLDRIDSLIDQVAEAVLPGERGEQRRLGLIGRGDVPVSEAGWRILARRCAEVDVPLPESVDPGQIQ